jgi:hypothetical protein
MLKNSENSVMLFMLRLYFFTMQFLLIYQHFIIIFQFIHCFIYLFLYFQVIIRVFGEGGAVTDVPVTPETTCQDVVECTRDPGEDECRLVELWRDCGKSNTNLYFFYNIKVNILLYIETILTSLRFSLIII